MGSHAYISYFADKGHGRTSFLKDSFIARVADVAVLHRLFFSSQILFLMCLTELGKPKTVNIK